MKVEAQRARARKIRLTCLSAFASSLLGPAAGGTEEVRGEFVTRPMVVISYGDMTYTQM